MIVDDRFREISRGQLPPPPKDRGRITLGDGSYLFVGWDRTARGSNSLQRLLATQWLGTSEQFTSWEMATRPSNTTCLFCNEVSIAAATSPSEFWTVTYGSYELEKWSASGGGRLLASYRVAASWFERVKQEYIKDLSQPSRRLPRVPEMAVRERKDGLLIVASRGIRTNSNTPPAPPRTSRPSTFLEVLVALEPISYTQIDVIDTSRGILASATLEGRDLLPIDDRFACRFFYDSTGTVRAEIWEISFRSQ